MNVISGGVVAVPVVTAPCGCLVLDDEWCRTCGGCGPRGDEWAGCCTCGDWTTVMPEIVTSKEPEHP
jgi:hypothetical protein